MAHVNISLDDELTQKAKEAQINISAVTEKAIKDRLSMNDNPFAGLSCAFCGRPGERETADEVRRGIRKPASLTWLCPDEKWCCNHCLDGFIKQIPVGI